MRSSGEATGASVIGSMDVAHTFDDLVEMQQAADEAHAQVLELRDRYGRPTEAPWSQE
ncbi:hypothetical protein GCM10022403_033850 [Streptomyces coacervatus]|uniref:Uncharacterized protein n=1 Tax=Streptomyces coacervatus TaxID=647381 RepID=A0ABP7HJV1_9ACTN